MKTIRLNIVILLLFLIPGVAMAGIVRGKYTKEKKINKSFSKQASLQAVLDLYQCISKRLLHL